MSNAIPDSVPYLHVGVCAVTGYDTGDCGVDDRGSFHWPLSTLAKTPHTLSSKWQDLLGLQACVRKCLACSRCRYVSFSRFERDCSWYSTCNLNALSNGENMHRTVMVRHEGDVSATAEVESLLNLAPQRGAGGTPFAESPVAAPPRLLDMVVYGGPHYDALLEMRMFELRSLVLAFVVIEHARPSASARRFDPTSARFLPYANITRRVQLAPQNRRIPRPRAAGARRWPPCTPLTSEVEPTERRRRLNVW